MGDSPVNEHSHPHKGTESSNFHDPEKATHFVKNPASSIEADHGAETDLRRSLGTRHLTMIGLGASIGMGLWLGSGTSLVHGGPAAIFIGYVLSGSIVWSVTHSIGELGSLYPLPSAFVQWSSKFVDPAAGFALGWAYWLFYWIAIANELQVSSRDMCSCVTLSLMACRELSQCSTFGLTKCQLLVGSLYSGL